MVIRNVLEQLNKSAVQRIWVFSDLQQSVPEDARRCFETAVRDFRNLALPCDYIWYLGDATEGKNGETVKEMCDFQLELLVSLNIPVRYVMGNHEFDLLRSGVRENAFPFYEAVNSVPGWRTISRLDKFYFVEKVGNFLVAFFSDHGDLEGRWHTTNGKIYGEHELYPYDQEAYREVSQRLADSGLPVITVSHYALQGGNRPSELLSRLLPLPVQAKAHLHGHAHIGDDKWAGPNCHQKISWVAHQDIPQINVSSLEDRRGSGIRSVFLEMYADERLGFFFRNHTRREWTEMFIV